MKILKMGIEFNKSRRQRYPIHANIFIYNFDQMQYFLQVFLLLILKKCSSVSEYLKKLPGKVKIGTKLLRKIKSWWIQWRNKVKLKISHFHMRGRLRSSPPEMFYEKVFKNARVFGFYFDLWITGIL